MHLTSRVREFLIDQNYYIDIYDGHIHVFHYVDIVKLQEEEIVLQMESFLLKIYGSNFRVKRLETQEILLSGNLERMVLE